MPTFTYPNPGRSFVRPAILLLAVAGTSYVVGVLLQNPISSRDVSALLAAPAQAAESNFANPLQVTGTVASVRADERRRFDGERILQPRECDLPNRISTECMFLD
jgi:hypothetical protein